jgi:hypothetical protein
MIPMSDLEDNGIRTDARPASKAAGAGTRGTDTEKHVALPTSSLAPRTASEDHDTGPPNGGIVAWLQVAAAFVLYGNTL